MLKCYLAPLHRRRSGAVATSARPPPRWGPRRRRALRAGAPPSPAWGTPARGGWPRHRNLSKTTQL